MKSQRTTEDGPKKENGALTEKEIDVYAAAIRHAIYNYPGGGNGVVYLAVGEQDAPPELLGRIFRPASRAHLTEGDDPIIFPPGKRIRDKVTGEAGSIITVKIIKWLGDDRVKVECECYTAPLWAGGCAIFLRLEAGEWIMDGEDPNSFWVS